MSYRDVVTVLLEKSSAIARGYFGKVDYSMKKGDNNQVLTKADLEIGEMLVSEIEKAYPGHNIVDEESGVKDKTSNCTWVIDPIDGTGNFAMGIPLYGIIIGLLENDLPVLGGVALPYFDEIYYAEKGQGSYRNGDRITVTDNKDLSKSLVAYGLDSHPDDADLTKKEMNVIEKLVGNIQNLRASNSVYDAMMVASGRYGGYANQWMRLWDVVGLETIINEAGGIVTDIEGKRLDYKDHIKKIGSHYTFLGASASLHGQILSLAKESQL